MAAFDNLLQDVQSRLIHDVEERFVLPATNRPQQLVKGDERARDLGGFTRYPSEGDGNCVFRSYSQAMVRHQKLNAPIRFGTAALMRLHPELYNTIKMSDDDFDTYIDAVEQLGNPVLLNVSQAASDLLEARIVRTNATTSQMLTEIIPHHDQISYEINVMNVPEHFDTLGRDHLYPYHLKD